MSHYTMLYKCLKRTRNFGGRVFIFILFSFFYILGTFLRKTIIPLALVGYEMITANSALRASLAIYHFIPNARSWNNCELPQAISRNFLQQKREQ